jgi:predicted DNA-binding transcriptional regulator AlpA
VTEACVTDDAPRNVLRHSNSQVSALNDADDAVTQKSAPRTDAAVPPLPLPAELSEGVTALARPKMLKLPEVLEEIEMSRAAFYRMRARGQAPKLIKLPNGQLRCRRADLDAWWSSMEDAA